MSVLPAKEPACQAGGDGPIDLVLHARPRDLGGFAVRRVLPSRERRRIGPFVFWDHMGPATLAPGQGMDVRPHPHINLATVTYLFDGEIDHRDSLGSYQRIVAGAVNWMTAGRGIVHSERTGEAARRGGTRSHGIQSWVALPKAYEEVEPSFHHHPADTIPDVILPGAPVARVRIVAGSAYGAISPVHVFSPMFYVEARLEAGARLPMPDEYEERAAYVVEGQITAGDQELGAGSMLVARPACPLEIHAGEPSRVMLMGGAPLDGERHIWWNFVSSSEARIEQAKRDWKEGRFPKVPGDEVEFIPLPE
jgi:redox-sensitive bicupin YhaK (pirin superfamily)